MLLRVSGRKSYWNLSDPEERENDEGDYYDNCHEVWGLDGRVGLGCDVGVEEWGVREEEGDPRRDVGVHVPVATVTR